MIRRPIRNPGGRHARKVPTTRMGEKWQNFMELPLYKKALLIGLIGTGVLMLVALLTLAVYASSLSTEERLMNRNNTGVILVDRHGKKFYEFNNPTSKTYVKLGKIDKNVQHALIAAEDKDFYEHEGFSVKGLANAMWQNIRPGGLNNGGSTITQQLVKNALLTNNRSFFRKFQELILAVVVDQRYTKGEILEMYLNSVYFGEGYFGIEDAARGYFGVHAKDLTLAQASMLIGLLPAPAYYSPTSGDPDAAKERQEYVLERMVKEGYVSESGAEAAKNVELSYRPQKKTNDFKATHFALMVKDALIKKYGEEKVARSGFIVRTTLDLPLQEEAESAVKEHVASLAYANASNASAVAVDPKTGEILSLVGSTGYATANFGAVNMATTPRQPGSSFKPIVYGTGIEERKISAATILHDKPTDFGGYTPENYDLSYYGDVTTRVALANSRNVPAVEAMQMIGIDNVINQARRMGITTLDQNHNYGLSLALGTGDVKLTELTNAYAAFANQGEQNKLHTIIDITNKYKDKVYAAESEEKQVISDETSYIMSQMLSDNNARARTFGSSLNIPSNQVAVKTGTTEDYSDAWTVGYTPSIAVGVWMGNNDNKPMQGIAGSIGSGPIWQRIIIAYLNNHPSEEFPKPSGIITKPVCVGTGAVSILDFPGSQPVYLEYFRSGTVPSKKCNTSKPKPKQIEVKPKEEDEDTTDEEQTNEEDTTTPPDDNTTDGNSTDTKVNGTESGSGATTPPSGNTPTKKPGAQSLPLAE